LEISNHVENVGYSELKSTVREIFPAVSGYFETDRPQLGHFQHETSRTLPLALIVMTESPGHSGVPDKMSSRAMPSGRI
jgi:hypothetical protein